MNRRDAEFTEKKKKRNVSRWRYFRLFIIPVMIFLIASLSLIAFKFASNLQQYNHNRRLWDEGNYGGAVFPYVYGYGDGISVAPQWTNSDDLWTIASDCVRRVFCTIRYNAQYHYPEYIYPKYNEMLRISESIQVHRILFCSDKENHQICEVFLPRTQN